MTQTNTYQSLKIKEFLIQLFLTVLFIGISHGTSLAQFGFTATATNPTPNSISICDPDPDMAFYTIDYNAFGTGATNPRVDIPLPNGATYLTGSGPAGAAMVGNRLRVPLADLAPNEAGSFQFKLVYDCNLLSSLSGLVTLNIRAIADEGTNTSNSNPINNTVVEPHVIAAAGANVSVTNAEVTDMFTRTFSIRQTGLNNPKLFEFEVCVTYETDIIVTGQTLGGVDVSGDLTAAGGCLIVNSTTYPGLAGSFPMREGDELEWSENVEIIGCDNIGSLATTNWGCNGSDCQSDEELPLAIELAGNSPVIEQVSIDRTFNNCIEDGAEIEVVWRIASGKAFNLIFSPSARNNRTVIDPNSVEVDYGSGTYSAYVGGINNSNTTNSGVACIPAGDRYTNFDLDPFTTVIDASSGPQIIRLKYIIKTCCNSGAGCRLNTGSILGASPNVEAENMCGISFSNSANVDAQNMNTSTADNVPAYIADSSTETWQYEFNDMADIFLFAANGQICVDFSVDDPIVYQTNSIRWVDANNTSTHTPISETVSSSGGATQVFACFAMGDYFGNGSKVLLDGSYTCTPTDCGATVNSSMDIGFRFGDGTCSDNCVMTFLCEDGTSTLGSECCGTNCDGMSHRGLSIARTCFGEPDNDNDGCADVSGTIDLNLVRSERAMEGDELRFTAIAEVNLMSPTDSFNYVYFEMTFPSEHGIGSTATLEIDDASTGMTYTCSNINIFNENNTKVSYYLTTDLLRGCGTIPADFIYQDGDLLRINGTFVNLDNPGCLVQQLDIDAQWFADRSASPVGIDRLQCNLPIPGNYSQVGYNLSLRPRNNRSYGCGGAEFEYSVDFCIGGGSYLIQPFPYEIRNFMKPLVSGLKLPPGLVLDQLLLEDIRFTKVFSGPWSPINREDITAYAQQANGYLTLDWSTYFDDCNNNFIPNGGYSFEIKGRFEGSCQSTPSLPEWFYEAEMDFCSPAVIDKTIRVDSFHNTDLPIVIPDINITTSTTTIFPFDENASWNVSIREIEGSTARNAWMMIQNNSGNIIPQSVVSGGTTIAATNGIYQLGDIPGGNISNFTIVADYLQCPLDSISVLIGWDCSEYPISDQQVIQGGLACPTDAVTLYAKPQGPALQQAIISEPSGPIAPCTTFDYELEVKNVDNAVVYEPFFELFIPYTAGVEIISGTEQGCYPCDSNNPVYNYGIFGPTEVIYTALGIKYIWNLEALVAEFDFPNDMGWEGEAQANEDLKRFRLRFQAKTNCNHIGGDFLNFRTKAHTYCGEKTETILRNGIQLEFDTPQPDYKSFVNISDIDPFSICGENTDFEIEGVIVFFDDTDGMDSLIIALPSALEFEEILFNPSQVNESPVVNIIGPGAGPVSFEEIRIKIDEGITNGTAINFLVKTKINPEKVLCEEPNTLNIRTVRAASFLCEGVVCDGLISSGSIYPPPVLEMVQDSFELSNLVISTPCGMNTVKVENLTITNAGDFDIDKDINLDFYYDADNSGNLSSADVLLGSSINSVNIAQGATVSVSAGPFNVSPEQTCKIIAVASGCSCETKEIVASSILTQNAGDDLVGCSSAVFPMGCGEDLRSDGFQYQWFGLNGAPLSAVVDQNDPNTDIIYEHFNVTDLTLEYILLTTHPDGDCNSVDTVALTFKGVAVEMGGEIVVCADSIGMMNGPLGFFNYQWTPTTGIVDPIDPRSPVQAPVGRVVYRLSYTDLTGCNQYFEQRVRGTICTDLELIKEVTPTSAVVGDVLTYDIYVINQGPNGASGIEVADTLPNGLTYLNSVPTEYDPLTHIWTIPDIMLPDDTARLTIYAQITEGGPISNVAQISNMNEGDLDSFVNNDVSSEDDQQGVCTSAPINLLCREIKKIGIDNVFNSYQWFKDGMAIDGATTDSLELTEAGSYEVLVDGGNCPYNDCCPFEVFEEPCAGIGDYVWEDLDGNGIQDPGENPIENVTVYVYDASTGLPVDSTTTDANGNYLFEELPAGNYYLSFDNSTNTSGIDYEVTSSDSGGDDTLDSDINSSGITPTFTFDPAVGDDLTFDAGFVPMADIGNFVWVDANFDGIQNFGEAVVPGVTVNLYNPVDGALIGTAITDANGMYLIEDIPFGDYYIEFDLSTATGFIDYAFTDTNIGDGMDDSDANSNGETSNFSFDPRNGDDLTYDAGIYAVADIGNQVWLDNDMDGMFDAGVEPGVENVTVVLIDNINGLPVDTVLTDANGNYLFEDVRSGDYSITYDYSTSSATQDYFWTDNTAGVGNNFSEADPSGNGPAFTFDATMGDDLTHDVGLIPIADIGNFVWIDEDMDGIQDPNEAPVANVEVTLYDSATNTPITTVLTDVNGEYVFPNIPAGDYYLVFDPTTSPGGQVYEFTTSNTGDGTNDSDPDASGQTSTFTFDPLNGDDLTLDAGLIPVANIGNFVWKDLDMDGIQDPGEPGLDSVLVVLYDGNSGNPIDSMWTDANGMYLFEDIPAGDYFVGFESNASFGNMNNIFSPQNTGNGSNDSDADISGFTSVFAFDPQNGDDLSIDAGVSPVANLGDLVFIDSDGDGQQDLGEPGVAGVTVNLLDDNGNIIATTITDANGNYLFTNISSGMYSIAFDPTTVVGTTEYDFTASNVGNDATDSDADASGMTTPFVFDASAGDDLTIDAGLIPTADIGNFVWIDADGDGLQDPSEVGISGVTVNLLNDMGNIIATTTTDTNGEYVFEDVPAGMYSIGFDTSTAAGDYDFSPAGAGDGTNDSEADPLTGITPQFTFDPLLGDDDTHDTGLIPTADIGNFVWIDSDMDGIQDVGEIGLDSVLVVLYASDGTPLDSAWTDANGMYLFEDIIAGDYYVGFEPNASFGNMNFGLSPTNTGNGSNDSDADSNGFTSVFSFDPQNGDDLTIDAGVSAGAGIGSFVWVDTNGDGIQNPGETGIAGVTVNLYDDLGNLVATTTTDANGEYLFSNIPSGDYYVEFDGSTSILGPDYNFTGTNTSGDSSTDSDAGVNGQTAVFSFDASAGDDLTIDAGLVPDCEIATVKAISNTTTLATGNIDITFELAIKNTGVIDLNSLSLTDDLSAQLGTAFVGMSGASPNLAIISSTATSTPMLNTAYNGMGNNDVFIGSTSDLLKPDEEIKLILIAEIDPLLANFPIENQTQATGDGLDLNGNQLTIGGLPITVTDDSDSGYDLDGSNPGEPGDNGTPDDPTELTCSPANIDITGEPAGICAGEPVDLQVASTLSQGTYRWRYVGDNTVIAVGPNPTFTGLTTTTDVWVEIINTGSACVFNLNDTTTINVFTNPMVTPVANYTLNSDCSPANLTLNANLIVGSGAVNSYSWTGPNGYTSNVANPIIPDATEANNGSYTLIVTDENGCTSSGSVQVSDIENAQAQPVVQGTGPACEGGSITLTVATYAGANVTYFWSTPSGTNTGISGVGTNQIIISPVDNSIHEGIYTAVINVDGCILAASYNVIVYDNPIASAVYMSTDSCNGGEIVLEGAGSGIEPLTYQWSGPNGFTSSQRNITISDVDESYNGLYTLTVNSQEGCAATADVTVDNILAPIPPVGITTNGPTVCDGNDIVLETSADGVQFEWIGPLGSSTSTLAMTGLTTMNGMTSIPASSDAYVSGNWSVRVTDTNGCTTISDVEAVTIQEIPVAVASNSGPVCETQLIQLFAGDVPDGVYRWYDGDPGGAPAGTLIAMEKDPIIYNLAAGSHDFFLTVEQQTCVSPETMTTAVINTAPATQPTATYVLGTDCAASDLTLNAGTILGTGAIATYQWSGPNNFTSNETSPVIPNATEASNGSYQLTIIDENGCSATGSVQVSDIMDMPAMPQITSGGPDCEGGSLTLNVGAYTAANVDYTWTTPAGNTTGISGFNTSQLIISPLDETIHVGDYSVVITVDGCVLESDTFNLELFGRPTASLAATTGVICEGDELAFTTTATGAATYEWIGPNDFTSNTSDPVIANTTINNNGTYTLVVTNTNGCSSSETILVNNIEPTPSTPTASSNGPVCEDGMINLSIQQSYAAGATYTWTNGAGATIGSTSSITINPTSAAAISPYRVMVTEQGCPSELSEPIEVDVIELPVATASNNGTICPGEAVQLLAGTIAGASYEWRISGTTTVISTDQNPTIFNLTSSETYELTVITDGCISDPSATTTVVVNTPPTTMATANYTLNTNCSASDLSLTSNAVAGSGTVVSFEWSGPNGFSSMVPDPIITDATEANNGSYTLIITDENGCTSTRSIQVTNIMDAVAQPVISSTGPACDQASILLEIPQYNGSNVTYNWTTPNNTNIAGLNTNQIIISPVDTSIHQGTYSVEVIVDGCTLNSNTYEVSTFESAIVMPTSLSTDSCSGGDLQLLAGVTGNGPFTYQWIGPNGFVSNLENPNITGATVANNGQYIVEVMTANGCTSSQSVTVNHISPEAIVPVIDTDTEICEGDDIVLETSTDGDMFEWIQFSDSQGSLAEPGMTTTIPSTTVGPGHPFYQSGPWRVRVTNADGCNAESVSINVTINEIPEALAANNSPVCQGMPITLSSNTLSGGEYRWYDGDPMGVPAGNLISMNGNVEVNDLPVGSHDFYLTITQNGCESPASITTVVIEDAPVAAPTSAYTLQADCAPADLELFANATSGSTTITYSWTGPNGFSSTLENPVIPNATEASNGSYILTINDGNVCTTTETVEVSGIMNQQAMPLISHNGAECAGDLVEISVPQYTGAAVDYVWTTPTMQDIDGLNTNSLVISPVDGTIHNGDYSVEITIDGCVVNSDIFTLTINNQPSATPTATAGVICSGDELSLTANGSANVNSYQWTGPNSFNSIAENPTLANVAPQNNGTYTLTIQTSEGCTETESITVNNIVPTPVMATITTNGPVCSDEDIILNIQEAYAGTSVSYQWTNGAGTLIGTSASISIAADDANAISPYRMEVTVDGCASELSTPTAVTVNELPESIATNAGAICAGESAQLFANPIPGASYEWRLSGSSTIISTEQNPVIADLTSDMTFELTVINNSCTSDPLSTTTVTVNQEPITAPSATYIVATDCAASDLELFANATGTGNLTYQWTGPNGFSSVAADPVIGSATESANGNYEVTITDQNGCTATGNVTINTITNTVAQPVIASSGPACEGEQITLNVDSYSGTNVTYTWTTPGGTTTNITGLNTNQIVITPVEDATHTGTYMVTIQVDGCTLESQTIEVDVFDTPTATPMATASSICEDGDLALTANASGTTSYQWIGPNGFSSTLENPNIVNVTSANNGQYTLVITNVSGCTQTESIDVSNILETPEQPTIEVASICEGEDIILTTSATGSLFEWIGPLGSSSSTLGMTGLTTTSGMTSLPMTSASYLPGDWSVRVTDANGCTSISEAEALTINAVPVAEAFNSGSICPGEEAQLMAMTTNGANYEWRDGMGTLISTEQNPMLSPSVTTTYDLTVINNGCISDPVATTTIVVNDEPSVTPTTSYTLNPDCSASDLSLFANESGTSGAIASYEWSGPNGFASAEENPVIVNATEAANGNYTLLVTNANGCTTTGTVTVTTVTNTVAMPVISATGPACEGEVAILTIPTYTGSSVDYVWTTPSTVNVTGENTNEITISPLDGARHEGDYTVTVTVDGCILTSDTYTIDVLTQPTASPIATSTPLCEDEILSLTANGTNAVSYQWNGPNGFSSNAENPTIENITVAANGTYTLVVTSESGCAETVSVDVTNIQPTPVHPVVTTNGPVCIDDIIELSIQQQYAGTVSYEWTNGAGVVIGTNQLLMIAANDGDAISPYRVMVTVDGCTSPLAAATEVIVNELPESIATNGGAVCPEEAAQLFANPIAGASYQWRDMSTGAIVSTEQNPSILPTATTTYQLTVINNGCISNPLSTTTVTVNDEPTVSPTTSYTLNTDCSASDLSLFANDIVGSGVVTTYNWNGPNEFSSAEQNPVIANATELANGNYTVEIIDANGCTTSGTVTVTDITNTVAQPVIASTGPACEGEVTILSIPAYTGSTVDYVWSTPSNINITGLNTNEIIVSPLDGATHEGDYTVTITVDGCVLTSDIYTIDVLTQPTASPVATSSLLCEDEILSLTANATDAVSYEWSGPNGFISNAANPEIENISVANNGTYTLVVTSESGCEATSSIGVSNIEPTPATPTITTNSPQCEDGMIVLSIQEQYTGGVITYEWTNGQGTVIGMTSTMMIAPTDMAAISPYRVMVSVDGCESPLAVPAEVEISDLPQAIATNGGSICPDEEAQLFANPVFGATYEWRDASTGNIVSTVQNPTLSPSITTTYELTVLNNGCVSNPLATTTVIVNDIPTTAQQ